MKYWNKKKKCREHWTEVHIPNNNNVNWFSAKLWCQLYNSKGRFYSGPYNSIWYFENAGDALVFKLNNGYK